MNQIVAARRHDLRAIDGTQLSWHVFATYAIDAPQLDGVATDCTQAWELHHYLIAWIGTLFCAFDHPASVVCLAITTGIFVQGLAAYGPAEISDRRAEYVDWSPDGPT